MINKPTINKPYDWMIDERSRNKRPQTDLILRQLDFDVTHDCNKNCHNCNLQISKSKFKGLTLMDFIHVVNQVGDTAAIRGIKFTGGEPLVNPEFITILEMAMRVFRHANIMVHTNGKLLPTVDVDLFTKVCWRISEYPGWNDEAIRNLKRLPNVYIYPWRGDFFDPTIAPNLSEGEARRAREKCMFSVRIIGRDLYGCCLSYSVEASGKCESVHADFDLNWQAHWKRLETWKACQHCVNAARV